MIRAVQGSEAQLLYGCSDALPARPIQAILTFEEDGDFGHYLILPIVQAEELFRLLYQFPVANKQGCALVERGRLEIEQVLLAI